MVYDLYDQHWSMVNQINVNHKFIDNKFGKQSSKMPSRGLQRSLLSHDVTSPMRKSCLQHPEAKQRGNFCGFLSQSWTEMVKWICSQNCQTVDVDLQSWTVKCEVWDCRNVRFETSKNWSAAGLKLPERKTHLPQFSPGRPQLLGEALLCFFQMSLFLGKL